MLALILSLITGANSQMYICLSGALNGLNESDTSINGLWTLNGTKNNLPYYHHVWVQQTTVNTYYTNYYLSYRTNDSWMITDNVFGNGYSYFGECDTGFYNTDPTVTCDGYWDLVYMIETSKSIPQFRYCTPDPTLSPTTNPTFPTKNPTMEPTLDPTNDPTMDPTLIPSNMPTMYPTYNPTDDPTEPSQSPTQYPSLAPAISSTQSIQPLPPSEVGINCAVSFLMKELICLLFVVIMCL